MSTTPTRDRSLPPLPPSQSYLERSEATPERRSLASTPLISPGSLSPTTQLWYAERRQRLLDELAEHDRKMTGADVERRLRHELFAEKMRREEEKFEITRNARMREEEESRRIREEEFREREMALEFRRLETERLRSELVQDRITGFSRSPTMEAFGGSAHVSPRVSTVDMALLRAGSSVTGSRRTSTTEGRNPLDFKSANQAQEALTNFMEERRLKKLARQKATDERRAHEAAASRALIYPSATATESPPTVPSISSDEREGRIQRQERDRLLDIGTDPRGEVVEHERGRRVHGSVAAVEERAVEALALSLGERLLRAELRASPA
ncbi:hypothetical protein BDK51DRAFT_48014, partial [Blyttiomyces helicus]